MLSVQQRLLRAAPRCIRREEEKHQSKGPPANSPKLHLTWLQWDNYTLLARVLWHLLTGPHCRRLHLWPNVSTSSLPACDLPAITTAGGRGGCAIIIWLDVSFDYIFIEGAWKHHNANTSDLLFLCWNWLLRGSSYFFFFFGWKTFPTLNHVKVIQKHLLRNSHIISVWLWWNTSTSIYWCLFARQHISRRKSCKHKQTHCKSIKVKNNTCE